MMALSKQATVRRGMKGIYQKSLGFTLIELMIVVAIIGILSSIAYPSYLQYVYKAKRATAATSILECAGILERRFTVHNTYETTDCDGVNNDDYAIAVAVSCLSNGNNNCYDITATSSIANDTACKTMSYDEKGVKLAKKSDNSTVSTKTCWRTS